MRARLPLGEGGSAAVGELLFDTLNSESQCDVSEKLNIRMIDVTVCKGDDDRDRRKSTFHPGENFLLQFWPSWKSLPPSMNVK